MKISAEFDSIEELLSFASTFSAKNLEIGGGTEGVIRTQSIQGIQAPNNNDIQITAPVQLHSPEQNVMQQAAQNTPQQNAIPVNNGYNQQLAPVPSPTQFQQPPMQQTSIPTQQPQQQIQQTPNLPTAAQSYTMDQLAVAATQIVDSGRRNDLVNLLGSFGVQALTSLPKEQYGAFATQLRAMGAKI
ncbi:hypothetical protein IAI10_02180 [Clostridium sp. 19966]|uniref:hypothetical protein n=1 Tax=Clostridium sp. 19966 TaxID=2768166 RepID=UPI0028DDC7B1|nr:hypothetical protein [Clostridium sp. 19966]MDT8715465.1 hypothetical protein [Clostridium sp. 19966]